MQVVEEIPEKEALTQGKEDRAKKKEHKQASACKEKSLIAELSEGTAKDMVVERATEPHLPKKMQPKA